MNFRYLLVLTGFIASSIHALAQPSNDQCSGAISTSVDGTCYNGTTVSANDNITGESGCATQGGPNNHPDVWYSFTATTTTVQFSIGSGTQGTIEMLLLTGTCGSLTLVNSSCATAPLNGNFAGLTIGQTYYYVVSAPNNNTGTFTSCWTAISSPPAAGQDCTTAQPICSNSSFAGNSNAFGSQEMPNNNTIDGCLTTEHQSSWYYFQINTGGTLEMTIDPADNIDYDFAIWGPLASYTCPPSATPVRCSYSATPGNTGLGNGASDTSESSLGNAWVAPMNVLTGEVYVMLIDNFTANTTPFTLAWGGTAILACSIMPVELVSFSAVRENATTQIQWATATETMSAWFTVEASTDGQFYTAVGSLPAAGYSVTLKEYNFEHTTSIPYVYYRLRQADSNGHETVYGPITVAAGDDIPVSVVYINLVGQAFEVLPDEGGIFIQQTRYQNGRSESRKILHPGR